MRRTKSLTQEQTRDFAREFGKMQVGEFVNSENPGTL